MERWDAYTKEGHKTGQVLIRGQQIPCGLYHLVCEVLVQHHDGSYLCMKRSMSKPNFPGWYEATAGGSALQGEDALQCVKRELLEETGICCHTFTEVARYVSDDDRCIFCCYICEVDCEKKAVMLQDGETEGFLWMSEEQFKDFVRSDQMIPMQKERYTKYFCKIGYL